MIFMLARWFFEGDFVFTIAGILAACYALILASLARWPAWVKSLYFVALTIGLAVIGHLLIERVQAWWITPLDEPWMIVIGAQEP